jgi:hypothetical protein
VDELIIYLRNLVSNCSSKLKKEIEIGIELENLSEITEKIKKLLSKLVKTYDLEDISDLRSTNEYWYAVSAITKDLKLVSFVIRNDGLPEEDDGSFYHEEDLTKIVS